MGVPMGKAEIQILSGNRLVAMPYALDVLYCQIPADGDWTKIVINEAPAVLGDEDQQPAQLSVLLAQGDVDADAPLVLGDEEDAAEALPKQIFHGGLLGVEANVPAITDITQSIGGGAERGGAPIGRVVITTAAGPASADLAAAAQPGGQRYHYYVGTGGDIWRLVGEAQAAGAADALTIGLEPSGSTMPNEQSGALAWLVNDLKSRYGLADAQVEGN
jgi:hypothetical protein